jgi:hypothetical protein
MSMIRQALRSSSRVVARSQTRHAHAISSPTLIDIEKRWEAMPPQEQADLWMALRDRMKSNWAELTLQEKKAGALRCVAFLSINTPPPHHASATFLSFSFLFSLSLSWLGCLGRSSEGVIESCGIVVG